MEEFMAMLVAMITLFSLALGIMHYFLVMFEKRIKNTVDARLDKFEMKFDTKFELIEMKFEKLETRIDQMNEKQETFNNELAESRKRTDYLYQMHCEAQKEENQKIYALIRQLNPQ